MDKLIPKNTKAVISYYLGVFSLLPLVGIVLGIAAIVLGIQGLRVAKHHPEAKGKIHAWVGIIVGGLFAAIYTVLFVVPVVILAATSGNS